MPTELEFKITQLTNYLAELQQWISAANSPAPPSGIERILERMVQLVVECAADAGDLWLGMHNRPLGQTAMGVFLNLRAAGVMDEATLDRFRDYVRSRNRIIHDYDRISAVEVRQHAEGLDEDVTRLVEALLAQSE